MSDAERRALEREARYSGNLAKLLECLAEGHEPVTIDVPPFGPDHKTVESLIVTTVLRRGVRVITYLCSRCGMIYGKSWNQGATLDLELTGPSARCRCGHSHSNHGTVDTLDFGIGPCRAFEQENAIRLEPGQNTIYATSLLDGVLTSPLCECGHSLRAHEGDGHCAAAEAGSVPQGNVVEMCSCRRFRRVPLCECGHVRGAHDATGACTLLADEEPPDPEDHCPCVAWVPVDLDLPGTRSRWF